jgi:DNA-binding transcriptional regulator YdaS (Cro superfamily)
MDKLNITQQVITELGGQKATAIATGFTQPAVHGWFHGAFSPSPKAAKALERATDGKYPASIWHPELFGDSAA